MGKRSVMLEWQVAKNEAEWLKLVQSPRLLAQTRCWSWRWFGRRLFGEVALLLWLLGGIGGWWWYMTKAELKQARAELVAAIEQAEMTSLQQVTIQHDQAVATVLVSPGKGIPTYRQTRFYQRSPSGWLPTMPDAAFWGPQLELESMYFRFHYRQQDALVVAAVAPRLDRLYATLRHNFGLSQMPLLDKLVIEVSITQPLGYTSPALTSAIRLTVPSPARYLAPVTLSDADLLLQSLALPLLDVALAQANERYRFAAPEQPWLNGLRLWQVWDWDLPLASWRNVIVTWFYGNSPGSSPAQADELPAHYAELCTLHTLWLSSPSQLHIPLFCNEWDTDEQRLVTWRAYTPPTHLTELVLATSAMSYVEMSSRTSQINEPNDAVAWATLVDYAVTTYGRERLPVLVAGLGQYESWETLLPAVYGVSVTEFEAGWQRHLAAHDGL